MRNVKGKIHLDERWGRCIGKGEKEDKGMSRKAESVEVCGVRKRKNKIYKIEIRKP
jgi:hypothetical protein